MTLERTYTPSIWARLFHPFRSSLEPDVLRARKSTRKLAYLVSQ